MSSMVKFCPKWKHSFFSKKFKLKHWVYNHDSFSQLPFFSVSKSFEEYDLESTFTSENDSIETTTVRIFDSENTTITEDNDDFYEYFHSDYEYEDKNDSISNDSYQHNKDLNGKCISSCGIP